jgi:hypothetical protein
MRIVLLPVIVGKIVRVAAAPRPIPVVSRQAGVGEDRASARRTEPMTQFMSACAAALFLCLTGCSVQTLVHVLTSQTSQSTEPTKPKLVAQTPKPAQHAIKPGSKPEPTSQELFEYLHGQLLSLSPSDGVNDNLEVAFDPASSILSITQPDGRCDIFLSAIDSNSAIWEMIDPSDANHQRGQVLRLTMNSMSGKAARACYDTQNRIDASIATNRARLFFSLSKANATPGFTNKMDKAIKKLIVQSGGAAEKEVL